MLNRWPICLLLFLGLGLAACSVLPGGSENQQRLPTPIEIQVATTSDIETLASTDERFQTIVEALPDLVGSVNTQARTLFTPQRFAQEVEPIEHVYLRFAEDVRFTGQDVSWTAYELVVASPGGEPMVLARAANIEDWSVYLPADPARVSGFLDAVYTP
jgi:hypothetical protein